MKRSLVFLLATLCGLSALHAIPQSFRTFNGNFFGPVIPATPRFGADLTQEFLTEANWVDNTISGEWAPEPALEGQQIARMTANPVLFGAVPMSVRAYREEGALQELAITYLDAGAFFGFKLGGEKTHPDRRAGDNLRGEFNQHFHRLAKDLRSRLEAGCGRGMLNVVGRSSMLRTAYTDYQWEDFRLRLAVRDGHSIALSIVRNAPNGNTFLAAELVRMTSREREERFRENVVHTERGDLLIENLPMFSQGYTPFCSVHSLAMAGHYYGLRMKPDGLVAQAGFHNTGSARGSNVLDLYHAAAEEVQMDLKVSSRFDLRRVERSLAAGKPVIVWRRVSKERESAHDQFLAQLQRDPMASLQAPSKSDQERWPKRDKTGSPSHASVVTGLNLDLNEVIFTEPWGEHARNRHMRVEEMEATTYAVFYFEF